MANFRRQYIQVTTDSSGDASTTDTLPILGKLYAAKWIDGDLIDGVDFVLTCAGSIVDTALLTKDNANADGWYYPRVLVNSMTDGAALTGTAGGDRGLLVIDGKLKLVVSSGGASKSGGIIVYYEQL